MVCVRGATTIEHDDVAEIKSAVKELLDAMTAKNGISREELFFIMFTSTGDIHSYYPARAARDAGYSMCPLFSAAEPEILGGLPLCIRIALFAKKENSVVQHVYLHGARVLRGDISHFSVALDGPAGSGKSTIAKRIAAHFGILHLDTGAMYRACALAVMRAGGDVNDESFVASVMENLPLFVRYIEGSQRIFLGEEDVSEEIRKNAVSMAASTVSKHACVREKMVEKQREIAKEYSCVLDGRDIGTVVLPDADFKFFLTASPEVRAKRRYLELLAKGENVELSAIQEDIVRRDRQDATRAISPLKQAEDAILIDTSELSIDEVAGRIIQIMQENKH